MSEGLKNLLVMWCFGVGGFIVIAFVTAMFIRFTNIIECL